jgi:hypothetical protein
LYGLGLPLHGRSLFSNWAVYTEESGEAVAEGVVVAESW